MSLSFSTVNMFTDPKKEGSQQPSSEWFIIVNGQRCICNKTIAEKVSRIIHRFYKKKKNKNILFETEIIEKKTLSVNSLNSLRLMISKIFCGEEIICQGDNFEALHLIGKHFKIQEITKKCEDYQKYLKIVSSHLNESIDFKEMIELEKMLLFEINEANIEAKVRENENLIKKIPIICLIHFVINVCSKNNKVKKIDKNEFIIEIINNIEKIVPNTLSHFISIMCNKFIVLNSLNIDDIYKFYKNEINSLLHQMFVDGMIENMIFNKRGIKIPKELKKYFLKKGDFYILSKENSATNDNSDKKEQSNSFFELIKTDNVELLQNYINSLQIDINYIMTNEMIDRISFINKGKKCSLIEISAFLGSIECFSYLYNKQAKMDIDSLSYFAVAGGNSEIIHICERANCLFNERTLDISIEYHWHKITKWLVETKNIQINERNLRNSIIYYNIKTTKYMIKKGTNLKKMIIYICESNNILLYKWLDVLMDNCKLIQSYQENKKTALHIVCEQNNVEIVKLLLLKNNFDFNSIYKVIVKDNELFNM